MKKLTDDFKPHQSLLSQAVLSVGKILTGHLYQSTDLLQNLLQSSQAVVTPDELDKWGMRMCTRDFICPQDLQKWTILTFIVIGRCYKLCYKVLYMKGMGERLWRGNSLS